MESHGGNVELLSLEDGVARIHLRGSCSDCSASSVTLELAIKQALEEAAPDLEGLEVEGVSPQALPVVMSDPTRSWFDIESVASLGDGSLAAVNVAGADLVVANVDGSLLAYRDRCAAVTRRCTTDCYSPGRCRARSAHVRSSSPAQDGRWTTTGCNSSRCRCCARRDG